VTDDIRETLRAAAREASDPSPSSLVAAAHDDLPDDVGIGELQAAAEAVLEGEGRETAATEGDSDAGGGEAFTWSDVDFTETEGDVYPPALDRLEKWMGAHDKMAFAPWADRDHADADPDDDARWKWGLEDNWTDGPTVDEWVGQDPRIDGRAFIQLETDPYAFVDGDDVRCPETGAVHPAFKAILEHLGPAPADISTSGGGVHAHYRGTLPADAVKQPKIPLDTEPWGANDDPPVVELYATKHLAITHGDHVAGTPLDIVEWDTGPLWHILDAAGELADDDPAARTTDRDSYDLEGYDPDATAADETADDIRDLFAAIDRLNVKRVADATIVKEWTTDRRSFLPVWGSSSDNGTANYVNDKIWHDTGHDGGYGGPVVMAAIDAGLISHAGATPRDVRGETWFKAVDHLRDLGFSIPELDDSSPDLDVISMDAERDPAAEAAAVAGPDPAAETEADADAEPATAETDGGATAAEPATAPEGPRDHGDRIRAAITSAENDDIKQKTARHRIATALLEAFHFVYPEAEVRGWRSTLYVYEPEAGVYEPRGEAFVKRELEQHAGDYVTNQVTNEIVGKIKRRSIARGDAFTPDPARLVVGNGILDLRTGELDAWTPTEYHRTKIDVNWNPDAGDPDAIDRFFGEIVADSDVDTLYRLIAHTLYKEYVGEKAAMLIGGGENGKSVFLEFVETFLGEPNVSHRALQDFDSNQFAANQLEGKLANIHPDMGDESVKDMSTFKKLTGRDTMTADVKYESPITFENFASLLFAANEMPVFGEDNHAVWRRWLYIDFPYTFDEDDPDAKDPEPKRTLMRRLTQEAELEALLLRCQQEVERWHTGEPWYPDAMDPEAVREQMKRAAEPVYDFAMTCLNAVDEEDVWLPKEDVRTAYREYATRVQLPKMGAEKFGEELLGVADLQIESGRPRDGNGNRPHAYLGVTWSERGRQLLGLDEPDSDDPQTTVNDAGDDVDSSKQTLVDIVQELVAENDNQPVSRDMVVGRAMAHMSHDAAERRIDDLLHEGRIYEPETDRLIDV